MAFFDLEARITEQDLSRTNRKTRQPFYLYIEAETENAVLLLKLALEEFLNAILRDVSLNSCIDVEICVFDKNGCTLLKECSAVSDSHINGIPQVEPTNGESINLTPVLAMALERIATQKRMYYNNNISYGKPVLLLFTAGNISDDAQQLKDVVARPLRETSVDIIPVCKNMEHPLLKTISSKNTIMHIPVEQAYSEVFLEIQNSMEKLSRSTAATYKELADCIVDGSRYFK
jgi:uncharacterized protein YegL